MRDGVVDLRSDTLTLPTDAMRAAMAAAEVGDDVYGEDPTVERLQARAAELLGKEAALFFPSGTMANQAAIQLHASPGEEVLIEASGHGVDWELGGAAALSGVQLRPIPGESGVLEPERLEPWLAPRSWLMSRVALLIAEQTHNMAGGRVVPPETLARLADRARAAGVATHLDGARLFNAAVATGVPAAEQAGGWDTVMVSLSKGLSAPVGSLLAGPAELMQEARRVRKRLGGAMRQVGVLAAAGLVALDECVERLAEDHARARRLADGLLQLDGISLAFGHVDTNIVVIDVAGTGRTAGEFCDAAEAAGVLCLAVGPERVRFVTYRHVDEGDVDSAVERIAGFSEG